MIMKSNTFPFDKDIEFASGWLGILQLLRTVIIGSLHEIIIKR